MFIYMHCLLTPPSVTPLCIFVLDLHACHLSRNCNDSTSLPYTNSIDINWCARFAYTGAHWRHTMLNIALTQCRHVHMAACGCLSTPPCLHHLAIQSRKYFSRVLEFSKFKGFSGVQCVGMFLPLRWSVRDHNLSRCISSSANCLWRCTTTGWLQTDLVVEVFIVASHFTLWLRNEIPIVYGMQERYWMLKCIQLD